MSAPISQDLTQCNTENDRLNDRKRLALELMLAGKPDTQIAAKLDVCRQTIARWRTTDKEFISELKRRRQAQWTGVADKLRALLDPAVDVLAEQLNDRYDRTRFRAASTLLRLANVKSVIAVENE